jgi:hypothetical protein
MIPGLLLGTVLGQKIQNQTFNAAMTSFLKTALSYNRNNNQSTKLLTSYATLKKNLNNSFGFSTSKLGHVRYTVLRGEELGQFNPTLGGLS